MVFDAMGFVTSLSKKVTMTILATSGGFEILGVSMKEIGAFFLATGTALDFLFGTSMMSLRVIRFPTVGTHVTGPEKPRQTGDEIVMAFLVEQDQLFVLEGAKRGDVKGRNSLHPPTGSGSRRGKEPH